ncbi:hypothetical protein B0H13DRAFT_2663827 [Mycena leptocephala]|nr:hypothetical protein B0H13DRAFT_2663827 [Mycena leptocephala]
MSCAKAVRANLPPNFPAAWLIPAPTSMSSTEGIGTTSFPVKTWEKNFTVDWDLAGLVVRFYFGITSCIIPVAASAFLDWHKDVTLAGPCDSDGRKKFYMFCYSPRDNKPLYPRAVPVPDSPVIRIGDDPEHGRELHRRFDGHVTAPLAATDVRFVLHVRHRDGKRKATLGRAAGAMPLVRDRQPAWLGMLIGAMLRLQDPAQQGVSCIGVDRWDCPHLPHHPPSSASAAPDTYRSSTRGASFVEEPSTRACLAVARLERDGATCIVLSLRPRQRPRPRRPPSPTPHTWHSHADPTSASRVAAPSTSLSSAVLGGAIPRLDRADGLHDPAICRSILYWSPIPRYWDPSCTYADATSVVPTIAPAPSSSLSRDASTRHQMLRGSLRPPSSPSARRLDGADGGRVDSAPLRPYCVVTAPGSSLTNTRCYMVACNPSFSFEWADV